MLHVFVRCRDMECRVLVERDGRSDRRLMNEQSQGLGDVGTG